MTDIPQFRPVGDAPVQQNHRLRPASAYLDVRPGLDSVVRRENRCFLVDRLHRYQDIEVQSDQLTPEAVAWYQRLTGRHRENMIRATWGTCLLSPEGKMERLNAMGVTLVFTTTDSW